MRIVQVVLENVKSYASTTTISLLPGINAICGENGAGKSTILEAIGFALFGHKPYKLDAFLREGEKSGRITVTVEDDNGCPYHLVRKLGTGAGQVVYNELDQKVAEGEAETREWRRVFFGLEPGADIEELFKDTIGPPQGTLTAIFLESPGPRKDKFDKLLGITEYREAAEGLRDVKNLFEQAAVDADRRAALMDGDVRRLPEVEGRQLAATQRKSELASRLAERLKRQAEMMSARERLEQAQKAVQGARLELKVAESRAADATRRQEETAAELRQAEAAAQRADESRAGSLAHQEASDLLKRLEERRRTRDDLRRSAEMAARNALQWAQEVKAAREKLEILDQDEARAAEKENQVPEQATREDVLKKAEERVRAHAEATTQLPELELRLEGTLARLREAGEQLSAVEAARPRASQMESLRDRERALREEMAGLERQEWALKQARDGLAAASGRLGQISGELDRLRREIESLRPLQRIAALAASRQESRDSVSTELTSLRTRHQEAHLSRNQVEGGLCPFLHEPCRNLRPGVSLDGYFDGLIVETGSRLAAMEAGLAEAEASLQESRLAEMSISRLPDLERRAAQLVEEREGLEREAGDLERRVAELGAAVQDRGRIEEELQRLDSELPVAEDAARVVSGEAGWRRQQEDALESKEREEKLLSSLRALLEREAGAAEVLSMARRSLEELGDPRGEAGVLRQRIARERPIAERGLGAAQRNSEAARAAAERASRELEPFASLEEEMTAAAARRDETEPDHRTFLASQAEAERLPQRRLAHERAIQEASSAAEMMVAARHALERIQATYDEEEHQRLRGELERLGAAVSSDSKELEIFGEEEQRLLQELDGLRQSKARMEEAERVAAENRKLRDAVEAVRDVLKRAGPEMTREMLRRVSARATAVYRELMAEPAVSLEWGSDYEIRCRVRAEEREFKQLSGGEQMGAALAIRLALLQAISNVRLAFLDEPTAHMDAARRVNLAAQIQNLRSFDQLVVISHDDSFDTLFGHVVHLAKRDGFTIVER